MAANTKTHGAGLDAANDPDQLKSGVRTETAPDGRVMIFRKVEMILPNGDKYIGELLNGKRHGHGALYFQGGDSYVGSFEDNTFHGYGIFSAADHKENQQEIKGRAYQGQWVKGKRHGQGLYRVGNGDTYEGAFWNDHFQGDGIMRYADGSRYEGHWSQSKWDGKGKLLYANFDLYDGSFRLNQRHGEGHYRYHGGGFYTGGWRFDEPHGVGRRLFASGAEYEGEWSDGRMCGRGIFRSAEGHLYVGTFLDNRFHGEGTLVYVNGDRYQGGFAQGVFYGYGRFDRVDGSFYEGEYKAELRCGVTVKKEKGKGGIKIYSQFAAAAAAVKQKREEQEKRKKEGLATEEDAEEATTALEEIMALEKKAKQEAVDRWAAEGLEGRPGHILVGSLEDELWRNAGMAEDRTLARSAPAMDGKRHGVGTQGYANGAVFTGLWRLDVPGGHGLYRSPEGNAYDGEWKDGKRHGHGKAHFSNGGRQYVCPMGYSHDGMGSCRYDGEWNWDQMDGYGVLTCCDGREYRGTWQHSQRHGFGVMVLIPPTVKGIGNGVYDEDGRKWSATYTAVKEYRGDFREGDRHGEGKITLVNGDTYEGFFNRNRLEGLVKLTFTDPVFGAGTRAAFAIYKNGNRVRWLRGQELRAYMIERKDTRFIDLVEAERLGRKVIEAMQMAAGHFDVLSIEDIRERKEEEARAEAEQKAKEALKKKDFSAGMKAQKKVAKKETDNEVKNAIAHADEAMRELMELSKPTAEQKRLRRRAALMKLYQDSEEKIDFTMHGLASSMGMSGKQMMRAATLPQNVAANVHRPK